MDFLETLWEKRSVRLGFVCTAVVCWGITYLAYEAGHTNSALAALFIGALLSQVVVTMYGFMAINWIFRTLSAAFSMFGAKIHRAFVALSKWLVRRIDLTPERMERLRNIRVVIVREFRTWLQVSAIFAVGTALLGIFTANDWFFGLTFGLVLGFLLPTMLVVVTVVGLLHLGLLIGGPYLIWEGIRDREWQTVLGGVVMFVLGVSLWWLGLEIFDYY